MSTTLELDLDQSPKNEGIPVLVYPTKEQLVAFIGYPYYYFNYWDEDMKAEWYTRASEKGKPDPPKGLAMMVSRWDWIIITTRVVPNEHFRFKTYDKTEDCWDHALKCGRSYLVGEHVPMDEFIKGHRSPLSPWQKAAYLWAKENPLWKLEVETKTHDWYVYARAADYVEFGLPHQDRGGERHYVTNNGLSKVLVNVD